jgi:hypothetical protein
VFSKKCDNGKKAGCINNCNSDSGYVCTGAPGVISTCLTVCGDYIVAGTEECDNENRRGCTNCKVDAGYTCKKDLDVHILMCTKA